MIKEKIKYIVNSIKKISNIIIENEIKNTFLEITKYNLRKSILFVLLLPLTIIFVLINAFVIIISLLNYTFIFICKIIKNRVFKKNVKKLKYKRRFKFLKNFYIIFLEKILITYPKQKAFLLFYIISKSIVEKNKELFKQEIIVTYIKAISNRYIISILIGIPYIVIYCNNWFVNIVYDLKDYNYENKTAFLFTVCLNILKDLTTNYSGLVNKLKIKIFKKKIIFNSKKELIKSLKYKKEFGKNFNHLKKKLKFAKVKHVISKEQKENNKITYTYSKEHFTSTMKLDEEKTLYLNETSSDSLWLKKYDDTINDYIKEKIKNTFIHNGTINEKKLTFYTPIIKTKPCNIIFTDNDINAKFILKIKEEKLNSIIAAFTLNLDKEFLESKFLTVNKIDKLELLKNIKYSKTIDFIKDNKGIIDNQTYESILGIQFFWEENEKIIKNMTVEDRILLCMELNLEIETEPKEINFKIFKDILENK